MATKKKVNPAQVNLDNADKFLVDKTEKHAAKRTKRLETKNRKGAPERNEWGRTEYQEAKKTARRNAARFSNETLSAFLETQFGITFGMADMYRGAVKRKSIEFYAEHLPCQRCANAGVPSRKGDSTRSRTNHWDHIVPVGGAFRGAIEDLPRHVWDSPTLVSLLCYRCNSEKGKMFDEPLNQLMRAFVRHKIGKAQRLAEIERHIKRVRKWLSETPKYPTSD